MHRRSEDGVGSIKTFCQKFFVSQCRKKQQGKPSMLCFRKFSVAKKFLDKKGWEYQDFPSNFFSHSAEKFSRVTLLCCVSECFRQQKCLQIGKRAKYQDFPSIFFSSHSVEKCPRGSFYSFKNFGYGESLEEKVRWESIKIFR